MPKRVNYTNRTSNRLPSAAAYLRSVESEGEGTPTISAFSMRSTKATKHAAKVLGKREISTRTASL